MTDEIRHYEVPGNEATIGHGGETYRVKIHHVDLPVAPWTAALEVRGVIIPAEEPVESPQEPEPEPQEPVSDVDIPDILANAGYDTAESIRAAPDDALLAISGVGRATLAQIREEIG